MVNKIVLDLQGFTSEWDLHEYMLISVYTMGITRVPCGMRSITGLRSPR